MNQHNPDDHMTFEAMSKDMLDNLCAVMEILRKNMNLVNPDDTAIEVFSEDEVLKKTSAPKPALAA